MYTPSYKANGKDAKGRPYVIYRIDIPTMKRNAGKTTSTNVMPSALGGWMCSSTRRLRLRPSARAVDRAAPSPVG